MKIGSRQSHLGRRQCSGCQRFGGVRATSGRCARCDYKAFRKAQHSKRGDTK